MDRVRIRAKGAKTLQPRAERSAALGTYGPRSKRALKGQNSEASLALSGLGAVGGWPLSQGAAAGLMTGCTFGASVVMEGDNHRRTSQCTEPEPAGSGAATQERWSMRFICAGRFSISCVSVAGMSAIIIESFSPSCRLRRRRGSGIGLGPGHRFGIRIGRRWFWRSIWLGIRRTSQNAIRRNGPAIGRSHG